MKMGAFCVLAVAVVLSAQALLAAEPASPDECVMQFFEASKNGDIAGMTQRMTGSFYKQRKTLLEEKTTYPDFLRKRYDGAHLQIMNMRRSLAGGWLRPVSSSPMAPSIVINSWCGKMPVELGKSSKRCIRKRYTRLYCTTNASFDVFPTFILISGHGSKALRIHQRLKNTLLFVLFAEGT